MKNCIILEVTNDSFEYVVNVFENTKQLADYLGVDIKKAQATLERKAKNKETKFIRVKSRGKAEL